MRFAGRKGLGQPYIQYFGYLLMAVGNLVRDRSKIEHLASHLTWPH